MVSPLSVASLTFQAPAAQAGKTAKPQSDTSGTTEGTAFSMLFGSLFAAADSVAAEESAGNPFGELTEALTEVIAALEELSAETLDGEEETVAAAEALIQTLSLLLKELEDKPAVKEFPQTLLRQFTEQLQTLAAMEKGTKKTGETPPTATSLPFSDAKDAEQAFKQLAAMVRQDDTGKQATGKQQVVQKLEELEQVLKQWVTAEKETEVQKQAAPPSDSQRSGHNASEAFRQLSGTPVEMNSSQVLQASSHESAKAEQLPGRSEPAPPTPTVRMANLTEELGEVLRGSFRLNGTAEGTQQIRINITPENLGHLDIRLTVVNGKMAAQIITSNFAAKEMLELQVNQLRASLLQQGVTVDKIEITQNNPHQSFSQQQTSPEQRFAQQQKQGNLSHKNGYQQFEEEAAAAASPERATSGNLKVDYTI